MVRVAIALIVLLALGFAEDFSYLDSRGYRVWPVAPSIHMWPDGSISGVDECQPPEGWSMAFEYPCAGPRSLPPKSDWDLQREFNAGIRPHGHYVIRRMVVLPCKPEIHLGSALFEVGDLPTPAFIFEECAIGAPVTIHLDYGHFDFMRPNSKGWWEVFDLKNLQRDSHNPKNWSAER